MAGTYHNVRKQPAPTGHSIGRSDNFNHLSCLDGFLCGNRESRAVQAGAHACERLMSSSDALNKRFVYFIVPEVIPPPFSALGGDVVNDWLFLLFSAFPLKDLNFRNARLQHACIANDT